MDTTKTTTVETYKGVKLIDCRTIELIDYVHANRFLSNNVIAEKFGIDNPRKISGIHKSLNNHFGLVSKSVLKNAENCKRQEAKKIEKEAKVFGIKKKSKKEIKRAEKLASKTKKEKRAKFVADKVAERTTFINHYGSGKEVARQMIAKAITGTNPRGSNILTLPADKWIMEKNILSQKSGYKFTAVEKNVETYKEMFINASNDEDIMSSIIGTHNGTTGELIERANENDYSGAILDYCGFIDTFYDEINDMMARNVVKKGGVITLTLAENDRTLRHPLYTDSRSAIYLRNNYINGCDDNNVEIKGRQITTDLIRTLLFNNPNYQLIEKYNYNDSSYNMLLFVIKRID